MEIEHVAPDAFDWSAPEGPAARVREIAQAAWDEDGADPLNEQVRLRLKHHGLRETELWLAGEGFALLHQDECDLVVAPDARGNGVGTALAAEVANAAHRVEAWSHADHPGAAALAAAYDVPRARELRIMRRPTSKELPEFEAPAGVTVRTFESGDEEGLLAVNSAAFAHHPEQGEMTLRDFQERTAEEWFDPAGLFVAVDADGTMLGFHWTKVHDASEGEVYVVAVNPKAAGRGLGTMLTTVGLRHLADLGLDSVLLYVDGDNAPALAVYAGLGFDVERVEAQYVGDLRG